MPKQVVRARPEVDDGAGPYVRLGWGKDAGYVELGTAVPEGEGKLMLPNRTPQGPDEPAWGEVIGGGEDVGWFVQLDRDGINQLIRHLREARNQAYGRDE